MIGKDTQCEKENTRCRGLAMPNPHIFVRPLSRRERGRGEGISLDRNDAALLEKNENDGRNLGIKNNNYPPIRTWEELGERSPAPPAGPLMFTVNVSSPSPASSSLFVRTVKLLLDSPGRNVSVPAADT